MNNKKPPQYRQSRQRKRILNLLRNADIHPAADWLYEQLKKEFPKLSLGTVYRNLTILCEQGLVNKIHFGSTFDRFEAQKSPHCHLICESCGKIRDIELPADNEIEKSANQLSEFEIHRLVIEFYGLCPDCK